MTDLLFKETFFPSRQYLGSDARPRFSLSAVMGAFGRTVRNFFSGLRPRPQETHAKPTLDLTEPLPLTLTSVVLGAVGLRERFKRAHREITQARRARREFLSLNAQVYALRLAQGEDVYPQDELAYGRRRDELQDVTRRRYEKSISQNQFVQTYEESLGTLERGLRLNADAIGQADAGILFHVARYLVIRNIGDKDALLKLISNNLDRLGAIDAELNAQGDQKRESTLRREAVRFIFRHAGRGDIRETVRDEFTEYQPPRPAKRPYLHLVPLAKAA